MSIIRSQIAKVYQIVSACKASLSNIAQEVGISKSSAKRRLDSIKSRSKHPCAKLFETPEGHQWLVLLIVSAVFLFGVKSNIGSETIAKFFAVIGAHLFIGLSKSSLHKIEQQIDDLTAKFGEMHDNKLIDEAKEIDLLAGVDETFFGKLKVLLLMDLPSGFILKENVSNNRDFDTWTKLTLPLVLKFKSIKCLVSDKARALVKLANVSFECISSADLFHVMSYVKKFMQFQFSSKIRKCDSQVSKLEKELAQALKNELESDEIETKIAQWQTERNQHRHNQYVYQQQLQEISAAVHPFDVKTADKKSSAQVKQSLNSSARVLRGVESTSNIDDKYKLLTSFENEITRASSQIDSWWAWVNNSIGHFKLNTDKADWLLHKLLPTIYWKQQLKKTRSESMRIIYKQSFELSLNRLLTDPLTKTIDGDLYKEYESWANLLSSYFQRTTSAVEGRHGILSQYVHSTRGLSEKRLNSLTVINNYYIQRSDGSTALERFAKIKPDCLIEFLMENIGDLPLPRKHKGENEKCLCLQGVPA